MQLDHDDDDDGLQHTCRVYSMVENCGMSSAGWCCSEIPAYCGGN